MYPQLTKEPGAIATAAAIARGDLSPLEAVDAAIFVTRVKDVAEFLDTLGIVPPPALAKPGDEPAVPIRKGLLPIIHEDEIIAGAVHFPKAEIHGGQHATTGQARQPGSVRLGVGEDISAGRRSKSGAIRQILKLWPQDEKPRGG